MTTGVHDMGGGRRRNKKPLWVLMPTQRRWHGSNESKSRNTKRKGRQKWLICSNRAVSLQATRLFRKRRLPLTDLVPVLLICICPQTSSKINDTVKSSTYKQQFLTLTVPANIFKLSKTLKTKLPQETVDVCSSRKINLLLESEDWSTTDQSSTSWLQSLSVKVQKYSKMDTSVRFIY